MSTLDRKEFRKKILLEIEKTEKDILDLTELTKPVSPENSIGRISRMDAINNKSINDAALSKAKDKLKKLNTALEKVENPDFGICQQCKKPIPEGRLMLMPHATRCVNCA